MRTSEGRLVANVPLDIVTCRPFLVTEFGSPSHVALSIKKAESDAEPGTWSDNHCITIAAGDASNRKKFVVS